MSRTSDPTALTRTFEYSNSTHSFNVKWCSLGPKSAPPVIFIHGTPWSSRLWNEFAIPFSRNFRVYLFDRPGFGDSSHEQKLESAPPISDPVCEYDGDLARQAEVFAALFKIWQGGWGNQKPHVIAHDNAGLLSLRAYLLHGCSYASLCLINVVAIGPFGQTLFDVVAKSPEQFEQLPDTAFEGILESYIRDAAHKELPKEVMQMFKAPWLRRGGKAAFIRQLCQAKYRNTDDVEWKYHTVGQDLPVKVLWGAQDKWIPVETAWRLGKALNAREVVEIQDAGHLCMYDQGLQLGIEIGTWIKEVEQ